MGVASNKPTRFCGSSVTSGVFQREKSPGVPLSAMARSAGRKLISAVAICGNCGALSVSFSDYEIVPLAGALT
jgi:hypothetical protein